jgi:hypothetical protein
VINNGQGTGTDQLSGLPAGALSPSGRDENYSLFFASFLAAFTKNFKPAARQILLSKMACSVFHRIAFRCVVPNCPARGSAGWQCPGQYFFAL